MSSITATRTGDSVTQSLVDARTAGAPGPAPAARRAARRSTRPEELVALIWFGALVFAAWPILLALRGPQPPQVSVVTAHVAGMLAGYGIVVLIGLMSRTPALERGVGADRLARWHGNGGKAVVALMLLHAWAAVQSWADSRGESTWLALTDVLGLPWLVAATIATLLLVVVAGISIRGARRRMSYEAWHTLHLLVYLGAALGFVHQLAGPDLAGHRGMQLVWALLYTHAFGLVLQHRIITPLASAWRHRLRVQAVVPEAPGVVSIIVRGRHLDELDAQSGQFFRWRFLTAHLWKAAHPFSLSAAPTSTQLRLTVKSLGLGSSRVQELKPGTLVLPEGPYGAMTAERRTQRDVLLIAGGVGITPMRALFETMPVQPGQSLLLLYRFRTPADAIFRRELDEIAWRRGAEVKYLSGKGGGRFTPELLHHLVPGLLLRDVYLCASPSMAGAVRRSLADAGLPKRQLHEERFDF
jgi:predicted ferric reductase